MMHGIHRKLSYGFKPLACVTCLSRYDVLSPKCSRLLLHSLTASRLQTDWLAGLVLVMLSVVAMKSAEVAVSASTTPFFTSPPHFGHFGLGNHSYSVVRKQLGRRRRGAGGGELFVSCPFDR